MLLDNFYTIIDQGETKDVDGVVDNPVKKFYFTIKLNPEHAIYTGHFPGNPVVPGVCQVQMIKELTSAILKTNVVIQKSDNIKFLSMIIPTISPMLMINIDIREKEPGFWHVNSIIFHKDQIFLKFKGVFLPV